MRRLTSAATPWSVNRAEREIFGLAACPRFWPARLKARKLRLPSRRQWSAYCQSNATSGQQVSAAARLDSATLELPLDYSPEAQAAPPPTLAEELLSFREFGEATRKLVTTFPAADSSPVESPRSSTSSGPQDSGRPVRSRRFPIAPASSRNCLASSSSA